MKTSIETLSVSVTHALTDELRADWQDLADRVGTVFSSPPNFAENVPRPRRSKLLFVEVRRDGTLVALAPFFVVKLGPFEIAQPLGAGRGVPTEFLSVDDEASDALWSEVANRDLVLVADSMAGSGSAMRRLQHHSQLTSEATAREQVPVIDVPQGSSAKDIRSGKSLKRLRRHRKQLSEIGTPMRFELIGDVEHLDRRWDDIVRVATAATALNKRTNYLTEGSPLAFLRAEADAGRLSIVGLTVGGEWRAHEIGIRTGRRIEGWLTHHDEAVRKFQPGHQMTEYFVESHDELGATVLDRGLGVNDIKKSWLTASYDVYAIAAGPRRRMSARLLTRLLLQWELSTTVAHARRIRKKLPSRH